MTAMRTGSPGITVYPFEDSPAAFLAGSPNKLFPSSKGAGSGVAGIGADDLPLLFSSLFVEQAQAKPQFQSQWSSAFSRAAGDSTAGDRNGMSVWGMSAVH